MAEPTRGTTPRRPAQLPADRFGAPATDMNFFTPKQAAGILALSTRTLDRYRQRGTGPAYYKLGGRIRYRMKDLTEWTAWYRVGPGGRKDRPRKPRGVAHK